MHFSAVLAASVLAAAVFGCGNSNQDPIASTAQALTGSQSRILGFEAPASDWSAANGSAIAVSPNVTQGAAAAAITPNGYTELLSTPMGAISDAAVQASFDLALPTSLGWGEVRLIVQAPSVGLNWQDLGGKPLSGYSGGSYHTLTFSVPDNTRVALASAAGDVTYRVVLNVPGGSGQYLLDNLIVADDDAPDPPPPPPGGYDFELEYSFAVPTSAAVDSLAVLGLDSVALENGVHVVEPEGEFAPVANSGSGQFAVGVSTHTASIVSRGDVFLAEEAYVHGSVTTGGAFLHQSTYHIDAGDPTIQPVETELLSRRALFKFAAIRDVSLEPSQSWPEPLEPGHYDTLTVKENSSITLVAGDYYFRDIWIEPGGTLEIDDTDGAVFLYAGATFQFKGLLEAGEAHPALLVTYLGNDQAFVAGPFRGSIFAPYGTVNLEHADGLQHEGTFIGKRVRVAPDITIVHRPFPWLIRSVSLSSAAICPGQTVQISVDAEDPAAPGTSPQISINGGPTSVLTEQWLGAPGPRFFAVSAVAADGTRESRMVQVDILDCGDMPPLPILVAEPDLYEPDGVSLTVVNAAEFEDGTEQYVWNFGDGQTLTTDLASVTHDYSDALPRDELHYDFDVAVTVARPGVLDASTTRTLVVWNSYAISKTRGAIEPPVEPASPVLSRDGDQLRADLSLRNREDTELRYHTVRVDYVPCDTNAELQYGTSESVDVAIPAGGSEPQVLSFAQSDIPADVCGVSIQFWGALEAGEPAQSSVFLSLPGNIDQGELVDEATIAVLNYLVDEGLVPDPDLVTEQELVRLYRERRIPLSVVENTFFQSTTTAQPNDRCDPDNPDAPPHAGYSCQPTSEWGVDTPGWPAESYIANAQKGDAVMVRGCGGPVGTLLSALKPPQMYTHTGLMTNNFREIRHSTGDEGYLRDHANGVAGQPSDGFEEDALRYFWPGTITASVQQAFVSGIRVSDPDGELRTVKGFGRDQVRCQGDMNVTYPRVVKPPPEYEELARPRLHAAAEASRNIGGHYRFSAYSNAQDTAANDPNGPPSSDQPNGKLYGAVPTVCSLFVRLALKEAGIVVDADKESPLPSDVRREPPDGIFFYGPSERLAAGRALYSGLYNDVQYELALLEAEADDWWWAGAAVSSALCSVPCGVLGAAGIMNTGTLVQWATDAPDDVGNQVTNCFASDYCSEDAKDSRKWKHPGSGFAVSPDDILNHYDPPDPAAADGGGVYGYHERMVFRGKRYQRFYRWLPSAGTTTVTGSVQRLGSPEPGATVEIRGLGAFGATDGSGEFQFDAVPVGNLEVYASKFVDQGGVSEFWEGTSCYQPGAAAGEWLLADCESYAVLDPTPLSELVVELLSPLEEFRKVVVQGALNLTDCDCDSGNETGYHTFYRICNVSPKEPTDHFTVNQVDLCEDEIGVSVYVECTLLDANRVRITGHATLYEDNVDTCGADDAEDTEHFDEVVDPGSSPHSISVNHLYNDGICWIGPFPTDCDDEAQWSHFFAVNERAD